MEQASKSYQVYALIDPRDKTTRYIGISKEALVRLAQQASSILQTI